MLRHNEYKNHSEKQKRKTIMAFTKQNLDKQQ